MRNERTKRVLAALLAVMLLAGVLSGCGKKGEEEGVALSEFVYVPTYTPIDVNVDNMNSLSCKGDTIYFSASMAVHADGSRATEEEIAEMNDYYSGKYETMGGAASGSDIAVSAEAVVRTAVTESTNEATPAAPEGEGTVPTEEKTFDISYTNGLFTIKTDGTGFQQLVDYKQPVKPEGKYSSSNLNKICVDSDGNLWVSESVSETIFDLPEGFDESTQDPWEYYVEDKSTNYIRKLSPTGAELGVLDLTEHIVKPEGEDAQYYNFNVSDMTADAKGNIYISDGNKSVYVANNNCEYQFMVTADNWMNNFLPMKDGSVAVSVYDNNGGGMMLKTIDTNTKGWGTESKIPSDIWNTSSGGNLYDFCYTDSSSLYGYDIAAGKETKILTWLNCDIDNNKLQYSTVLDDGNVFAITRDFDNESSKSGYEIVTLVKTPRSEVKQKTVLTMATMWLDYNVRSRILEFNKTNPDYRIEIQDYSEYNTEDDYEAGLTKLNTEIISGTVPDIIDVSQLPADQYAAKGLLEDLYPYLENDPDYSKEDFVQSILKAAEIDGKLYQMMSGFSIMSVIGAPSVVGTEMGWTMAEMQDIINQHPNADKPFGMYMQRQTVLQYFCMLNMDDYMDWQTGECKFNTDDFKHLLEFAKSFPDSEEFQKNNDGSEWVEPAVLIQDGRQLFELFSASDFQNFQYYKATFGGSVTFKGLPSSDRSGNVASFNGGLAITTSCKNKDGAWQFLRSVLSEEAQGNQWYFPITQKAFDAKLAEAMKQEYTTDENGNKIPVSHGGMSYGNGEMVEFYAITQEEADQFLAMIDSVTKSVSVNTGITNIILEDAEPFFKGEKTVDQTAEIIQSRMNIYINEQR